MVAAAAVEEAPAMATIVVGMTGGAIMTVPAEWKAMSPEARECLKRRNVTADRAGLLPGTKEEREEREDITIIPAFPEMSPVAVMRIRLI